jgi:hypothetical protein
MHHRPFFIINLYAQAITGISHYERALVGMHQLISLVGTFRQPVYMQRVPEKIFINRIICQ